MVTHCHYPGIENYGTLLGVVYEIKPNGFDSVIIFIAAIEGSKTKFIQRFARSVHLFDGSAFQLARLKQTEKMLQRIDR